MTIEVRLIEPEEFAEWRTLTRRGFGQIPTAEEIERRRRLAEVDRCFAAVDGGRIVGTGASHTFQMTVPGGAVLPTAGIASVVTSATHRRRGVMTALMRALLEQSVERREPLAALCPSESGIYGRFGFGAATQTESWRISTRHAEFASAPEGPGAVRFVDAAAAREILPAVWERVRPARPSWLDRSDAWWQYLVFDEQVLKDNTPFFVVYEGPDGFEGYALYRTRWESGGERGVTVSELVAASPAAHAALWRFVLSIDLMSFAEADRAPLDDPLFWMLADPRRLKRTRSDGVWLHVLDPAEALSARRYAAAGRVVIEVVDTFDPSAAGTFVLEADESGAGCARAGSAADIVLGAADLGAAYLGGANLPSLARAGRVEERTGGAVARFDRMLSTTSAPWCPHEF